MDNGCLFFCNSQLNKAAGVTSRRYSIQNPPALSSLLPTATLLAGTLFFTDFDKFHWIESLHRVCGFRGENV
jgi:hypothetical protein